MKIDWVAESYIKSPAKLAISGIPGKERTPNAVENDIETLLSENISYVISLVEEKELLTLNPPETNQERKQKLVDRGIGYHHQPIPDFHAPSKAIAKELIELIDFLIDREHKILLHCWAGLGRAGTILACYLASKGLTPQEAIGEVRWIRPLAIQSKEQEELIFSFG